MVLLVAVATSSMPLAARAQVRDPEDTISAGEGSGPLSDVSRPLRDDSTSVHDRSLTIGEASVGPMRSGPVRDVGVRSMLSGPVSELSRGPVREPHPPLTRGSVTEASAGAVKHDIASPLGERISEPLRELAPLQKQMRALRQQAEQAALTGASEPAVPPFDEAAAASEIAVPEEDASAPDEEGDDLEAEREARHGVDDESTGTAGEDAAPPGAHDGAEPPVD